MSFILVRQQLNSYGEIESENLYNIETLYDNLIYDVSKTESSDFKSGRSYNAIYKAIIDSKFMDKNNIDIQLGDKAKIDNQLFNLITCTIIKDGNTKYIYKVEFGL
jgi:hypothetical protein